MPNEQFYESGGVSPQSVLWQFASVSPARAFVTPRLPQVASTLGVSTESVFEKTSRPEKDV